MAMDTFTKAYVECALWASTDDNGEPMDGEYGMADIAPEALAAMVADCAAFQANEGILLDRWYVECGETAERAGMDFWLTRNGHGAGYWDRWASGTEQGKIGDRLTAAAKTYMPVDLYIGDDSLVHA